MSRILLWIFIIAFYFTSACMSMPFYSPGVKRQNPSMQISIDKDFSLFQQLYIQKAFDAWSHASQNKLTFTLNWNARKPGRYSDYAKPQPESGIFFWSLPKAETPEWQVDDWKTYWGVMVYGRGENSGNLIIFDEVSLEKFYAVALHEVGHLIGLKHIEKVWSNMHPSAVADCLTSHDVEQLCKMYGCVPNPECGEGTEH